MTTADSQNDLTDNISVFILEDEALVAQDIALRVQRLGYDVAAIRHAGDTAIRYLEIHTPDLILCDINVRGDIDGIAVAEYVRDHRQTPLIYITALSDRVTLDRAKRTLPYGYIVKPINTFDLLSAIEIALHKHSAELDKLSITKEKIEKISVDHISDREYEMLTDIIAGLTNDQISEKRHIAVTTVKYHIRHLLNKMDAKNRNDALHKIIHLLTQ